MPSWFPRPTTYTQKTFSRRFSHQNIDLIKHILEGVILAFAEDDGKCSVSTLLVGRAEAINEIGLGFEFVVHHLQGIKQEKDPDVQQDDFVDEELPEEHSSGGDVAVVAPPLDEQFMECF
ncbi:hypothetical protein M422DRAFT_45376 [Sphaerobolus stellatus SS14]|nr:hypothetical protein M422DRAFT_45376 [Sphaerobolus stellatus SS14]